MPRCKLWRHSTVIQNMLTLVRATNNRLCRTRHPASRPGTGSKQHAASCCWTRFAITTKYVKLLAPLHIFTAFSSIILLETTWTNKHQSFHIFQIPQTQKHVLSITNPSRKTPSALALSPDPRNILTTTPKDTSIVAQPKPWVKAPSICPDKL